MYDGSKGAIWFLNSYLRSKFEYEAKVKRYDISRFNEVINKMFSKATHSVYAETPLIPTKTGHDS